MHKGFQRITAVLLSGALTFAAGGFGAFAREESARENLVINGSFENQLGALGDAWDGYWSPGKIEIKEGTEDFPAKDGDCYLEISGRNAQAICARQGVEMTAGIPYKISAYLRVPGSSGHDMKIYSSTKGAEEKNNLASVTVGSDWTEISAVFTPKQDGSYKFSFIDVSDVKSDVAEVYHFDDFRITSDYINNASVAVEGDGEIYVGSENVEKTYGVTVKSGGKIISGSYSVTWSVDASSENDGAFINADTGTLVIPPDFLGGSAAKTVAVTAEVEDFGITQSAVKTVTVREYLSPRQRVENQLAAMTDESYITDEDKDNITGNLKLKTAGDYGTEISWLSESPDIIDNNGILLADDGKAHTVTMTAYVSYADGDNTYSDEKEFTVTTAAGKNLISNGSFETEFENGRNSINRGETLGDWYANWAYVQRVEGNAYSGKYCTKISQRAAQYQCLEQKVALKKGIPYTISAYLRIDGSTGHSMKIYTPNKDAEGKSDLAFATVTDAWTRLSAVYTPTEDGDEFKFRFIDASTSDVAAEYYFDKFTVTSDYIKTAAVTVSGPESLIMPESGSKAETYSISVKNSSGDNYPPSCTVKWSVDDDARKKGVSIDSASGALLIPEGFLGNADSDKIVIKAEAEDFGFVRSVEKAIEVKAYVSPAEILAKELEALNVSDDIIGSSGNSSPECITKSLDLNSVGRFGGSIKWSSSQPDIIDDDGELRTLDADWHRVTMTAEVTYEGLSGKRSFEVIVQGRYNLVINGDFEESFGGTDTIAKNSYNGPWYANWAPAIRVNGDAQSGAYYVEIRDRSTRAQSLEQTVRLKAGKTYKISVWVRMPKGAENHSLILSADNNGTAMANVIATADEWKELSATKICTADEDFTIKIFDSSNDYAKIFYADNYSVTCNMMQSAEIDGFDSVRKPESGIKTREYAITALDSDGGKIAAPSVEWTLESAPNGVTLEKNVLSVDSNAESGEALLRAVVEYDGVILAARKTVKISDYLNEKAIVDLAAKKLAWERISNGQKQDNVTENLSLPQTAEADYGGESYSADVKWSSGNESALLSDGTVTRSAFETNTFTLTGRISMGEEERIVTYNITVPKLSNLADNPGFEADGTKWSGGTITDEKPYKGSKSLYCGERSATLENEYMRSDHIYYIEGYIMGAAPTSLSVTEKTSGKKIVEAAAESGKWSHFKADFTLRSDEKAYFEFSCGSAFYLDDVLICDITDEYSNALKLTIAAEADKTRSAADKARAAAELLPDCDRKTALLTRIGAIKFSSQTGGGGGGGGSSKSYASGIVKSGSYDQTQGKNPFADTIGHWAEDDIMFLYEKGIVKGKSDAAYAPEQPVTRAEFAALAVRAFNLRGSGNVIFADVPTDSWYADAVKAAASCSVINGDGENFRPLDNVTREEAAVMMMRAYRAVGKSAAVSTMRFSDSGEIAPWAAEDIGYAAGLGIINGTDSGAFMPKAELTRAQAAAIIRRMFDSVNN